MKRAFRYLGSLILFLICVLATAEGMLRVAAYLSGDKIKIVNDEFMLRFHSRKYSHWMNVSQRDPFMPPYVVFSNRGFDDPERLKQIFEETKLPPAGDYTSHDFLLPDSWADRTRYKIHVNSLGFRGKELPVKKAPNSKRVIVLGAYHPFGHGLADEEAYPAVLESELNARGKGTGLKFEVWNGGRHASTAIVGLARMNYEITRLKPDLLILDYGFVDAVTSGDNFMLSALRFPDSESGVLLRRVLLPVVPIISHSLLWRRVLGSLQERGARARTGLFRRTMEKMIAMAREAGVPVILVKQIVAKIPQDVYLRLQGENVHFLDVDSAFASSPPSRDDYVNTPPDSWMSEIDRSGWGNPDYRFWPYRLNYFQLNAKGQQVLGKALAAPALKFLAGSKSR